MILTYTTTKINVSDGKEPVPDFMLAIIIAKIHQATKSFIAVHDITTEPKRVFVISLSRMILAKTVKEVMLIATPMYKLKVKIERFIGM